MSAHTNNAAHVHHGHHGHDDHGHGHDHDHDDGHEPSTFRGYMTGFVLAVILTVIPFWLVMGKVIESSNVMGLVIMGIGAVQIVVHMIYFLHMNARSEGGWNMLALIFTIVIVVITLAGSIWVMFHLNANMMPGMMHDMKGMG